MRDELQASGSPVALVARAGLDLRRFGQRYSHAGIALAASPNTPWSVRQLYFDCAARQPRLFDQGLPGFVQGGASPQRGHLSVLLLPPSAAQALATTALDAHQAQRLLGASYSANAHAWSQRHQNCNQWVAELLAAAWGPPLSAGPAGSPRAADPAWPRQQAQAWLRQQGYQPAEVQVLNPAVMLAGLLMPWVHTDDHPAELLAQQRFQVSLPAALTGFVQRLHPGARQLQLCHDTRQMVLREGDLPLPEDCQGSAGDRVIPFD